MNSVKTRVAEKRYGDKLKKDKEEFRLNTRKHKKQNKKIRKIKENYNDYNQQLQKKYHKNTKEETI